MERLFHFLQQLSETQIPNYVICNYEKKDTQYCIMVVPVFLPHLGCTERCIYCHQGYITEAGRADVTSRIDAAFAGRTEPCDVGLFGGNIFGIDTEILEDIFGLFHEWRALIRSFRFSTKPIPLRDQTIDLLKSNGVDLIELGIPTFNDTILASLNRGHTGEDLLEAYARLKREGFSVALQFMVGLPGEQWSDINEIIRRMVQLKPAYIRIYPLVIMRNTPLYSLYEAQKFVPDAFDDVLERACRIYTSAMENGIEVANVGLTDNELVRDMVAGGNYHPAYGFLVQSKIFNEAVEEIVREFKPPAELTVIIHKNDVPLLVGYKRENIKRFEAKKISVRWNPSGTEQGKFTVTSREKSVTGTASVRVKS
jgi:histone acetyltransferase (RNA polymerase elongator complex component)